MNQTLNDHSAVFNLLVNEDDITWQSILQTLVHTNQMDPWNIDVSLLSQEYINLLKKLKSFDCSISGKVVFAASLLLKFKSHSLVGEELTNLENMFRMDNGEYLDDYPEDFIDGAQILPGGQLTLDKFNLIPRTPQPRRRKVSIYDLMDALRKAMDVNKRRVLRQVPTDVKVKMPQKSKEITEIIREVFFRIKNLFDNDTQLCFSNLITKDELEEKIFTFIPLLHLSNDRKIDLHQENHFDEIYIELLQK